MAQKVEPQSLFKANTICLILQGRYAGKKCVVVDAKENEITVVGINQTPRKTEKEMTPKQIERRQKMTTFVKVFHARHLMPTRYTFKQGFSTIVNQKMLKDANMKKKSVAELTTKLAESYKSEAANWLFKKLAF